MNLYLCEPKTKIYTSTLDHEFIMFYQLTLPYYYAYQLIAIMHQFTRNQEAKEYLERYCIKKDENDDFRHGVIDAFCEIVKAGVKKIAFSHATNDLDLFANDLIHAYACAKKYDISFYIEENLIQTSLFHNSGNHVIIFYSNNKDIEDYLELKKQILNNPHPTIEELKDYGRELGRLLSYNNDRIEAMIETYFNS